MSSLLIKNGLIVTSSKTLKNDLLISEGKIVSIGYSLEPIDSKTEIIDADPFLVFPGGIDPHVHMELPTFTGTSSDDFESGTIAALYGGTTSIIDFVTPNRNESLLNSLKERKELAKKSVCDYALHMSLTSFTEKTYKEMLQCKLEEGITSFKVYLAYKDSIGVEDNELIEIMNAAKISGVLITLHCEHGDLIKFIQNKFISDGKFTPKYHSESRPPKTESLSVNTAIILANLIDIPIYIVHVSTKDASDSIRLAQSVGQKVIAETCLHYLLLDETEYEKPDTVSVAYVMSPPLRPKNHQTALWEAIKDGTIQTIGTDHCPFNLKDRSMKSDFTKIPNGVAGIEHRLSLVYKYGVIDRGISLNRLVDLVSTKPAKIFGLYPRKGEINVGSDADIILWDPNKKGIISAETDHHNCDNSIYEGFEFIGSPYIVISNGEVVIKENEFKLENRRGNYLYRNIGDYQ